MPRQVRLVAWCEEAIGRLMVTSTCCQGHIPHTIFGVLANPLTQREPCTSHQARPHPCPRTPCTCIAAPARYTAATSRRQRFVPGASASALCRKRAASAAVQAAHSGMTHRSRTTAAGAHTRKMFCCTCLAKSVADRAGWMRNLTPGPYMRQLGRGSEAVQRCSSWVRLKLGLLCISGYHSWQPGWATCWHLAVGRCRQDFHKPGSATRGVASCLSARPPPFERRRCRRI
jgi:hypothetical protein